MSRSERDEPFELLAGLVEVALLERDDPVDLVVGLERLRDLAGAGRVEDVLDLVPLDAAVDRVRLEPREPQSGLLLPRLERGDDPPLREPLDAPDHLQPGLRVGRAVPRGLLGPRGKVRECHVERLRGLGPLLEPRDAPGQVRAARAAGSVGARRARWRARSGRRTRDTRWPRRAGALRIRGQELGSPAMRASPAKNRHAGGEI